MRRFFQYGLLAWASIFWAGSLAGGTAGAATVVESGKPVATIVVGRQASPPSRFAAEELQQTLRRMSGAVCPIVTDDQVPDGPILALGPPEENPATARLLHRAGVDLKSLQLGPDGFLLRAAGEHFIVTGETGRATLYGVYALLERLGCRWCFPGEYGEVIPKSADVVLPDLALAERPKFSYRTFLQLETVKEATADWVDWMAKNRMNRLVVTLYMAKAYKGQPYEQFKETPGLVEAFRKRGMHIEAGNHASYRWIPPEEFFEEHPEFFAEIEGIRKPVRVEGPRAQLCFSNEEMARITTERIIQFAKDHPEADIISLYTNDGYGYCECAACRALGSKTDAYITYVNRVAEPFYQAFPEKKLSFLSYSHVSDPPTRVKVFGKNTICVIATWPPPKPDRLQAWLDSGAGEVVLYEYYMGSYSDRSLPAAWPKLISEELKQIHQMGLTGVASQCELDNWGAYGVNYWVAARMLWDPSQKLEDVLDDYYVHYYAEAAEPMKEYFDHLQTIGRMQRDVNLPRESIEKLDSLLAAGEKAAQSEAVRQRVRRDRLSLDYLKLAWEIEDARRQSQSFAENGNLEKATAELQRGAKACKACLEHMQRHRDERVFLVGDPDHPRQRVGYFYNTRYYQYTLNKFNKLLSNPESWVAQQSKIKRKAEAKEEAEADLEAAKKKIKAVFQSHLKKAVRDYPPKQVGPDFPKTREQWLSFAEEARRRLRDEVFHFPEKDCPLDARTVGAIDRGSFVIEKVLFRAEPDNWVIANLYVPKGLDGQAPAFICPSGHGGSKSAPYNQFFAQNYAAAGCVVLVPDPIGEEERDEKYRLGPRGHRFENRIDRCLELGISTIGKMTYDLVRGVDYLTSRPEVDPKRIGVVGHSLGGTLAEYHAAVDSRVTLNLQTAWTPNMHDIVGGLSCCWRPFGMLQVANNPELTALGATHCATLVLAGGDDKCPMHVDIFNRATIAKARPVYELFGRGDCLAVDVTPKTGHQPFQVNRSALAWTEKHFDFPRWTAEDIARLETPDEKKLLSELTVPFENKSFAPDRLFAAKAVGTVPRILPASALRCLKPGEEKKPEFSMAGWMAARQRQLAARFDVPKTPQALDARREELREKVGALLNLPEQSEKITAQKVRSFRHGNATVDELRYGLLGLSSYLIVPEIDESPPFAVFLDQSGTKEGALQSSRVKQLLADGTAVLALDAVPFMETTFLMGTSPTAYNVGHVRESIDLLIGSYMADPKQIACIGEIDDVALLAGFLDPRIARVVVASRGMKERISWQGYRLSGVVPGLAAVTTRSELAALIAPRSVRLETDLPEREKIEAVFNLAGAGTSLDKP